MRVCGHAGGLVLLPGYSLFELRYLHGFGSVVREATVLKTCNALLRSCGVEAYVCLPGNRTIELFCFVTYLELGQEFRVQPRRNRIHWCEQTIRPFPSRRPNIPQPYLPAPKQRLSSCVLCSILWTRNDAIDIQCQMCWQRFLIKMTSVKITLRKASLSLRPLVLRGGGPIEMRVFAKSHSLRS